MSFIYIRSSLISYTFETKSITNQELEKLGFKRLVRYIELKKSGKRLAILTHTITTYDDVSKVVKGLEKAEKKAQKLSKN